MIYTIVGFFGGMLVGKLIAMAKKEREFDAENTMMICAFLGAAVGFGFGSSNLISGTHIIQKIFQ